MVRHKYSELDDDLKSKIGALAGINDDLLKRTYLMRTFPLQEISSVIIDNLFNSLLPTKRLYNCNKIRDELIALINKICPGIIDQKDMRIIDSDEKQVQQLDYKTVDIAKINTIINHNLIVPKEPIHAHVSKRLTFKYIIRGRSPSQDQLNKIHKMMREYQTFEDADEKQYIYLNIFEEKSKSLILYEDPKFLSFLKNLIRSSQDKHVILGCLYILDRLIILSKIEKSQEFLKYVYDNYFRIFKKALESREPRYEYSLFKIQDIFKELKIFVPTEQLCYMYWNRMVRIIKDMKDTGLTDNSLWNCIVSLNKINCEIKPRWRKWLIKKDECSTIKDVVIKELNNF